MRRMTKVSHGLAATLLMLILGCGAPDTVSITGRVTYDGQPVDPGSIMFLPEVKEGGIKVAASIEKGQYVIPREKGAKPGKYRVEINWSRKTGKQVPSADPGFMHEEVEEGLPARFNTESTLTRDLVRGENIINFELQSK